MYQAVVNDVPGRGNNNTRPWYWFQKDVAAIEEGRGSGCRRVVKMAPEGGGGRLELTFATDGIY